MKHDPEDIETLPPIPDQMLRVLESLYPVRLPAPETTTREDIYHAGQRSVVTFLRRAQANQMERARER